MPTTPPRSLGPTGERLARMEAMLQELHEQLVKRPGIVERMATVETEMRNHKTSHHWAAIRAVATAAATAIGTALSLRVVVGP